MDGFSVIMPTYNQGAFIRRAILSLWRQTYSRWELIIVNDGSIDRTEEFIADYLSAGSMIRYIRNDRNLGMGKAINQGLNMAHYEYVAYLPSDDFYDAGHLENFAAIFNRSDDIVLAFSGMRYDATDSSAFNIYGESNGLRDGYSLQLVQAAHRKTQDRWMERGDGVSEDLFFTFWRKLADKGVFVPTKQVTCEWTNHPFQRHKIVGERFGGGLNKYRAFYKIQEPVKIRCTKYKTIDEPVIYRPYRKKYPVSKDFLKILLVGDLAYNPERIYALEQDGHRLYGLWSKPAFCYSTVGPLPFGYVEDIPYHNWKEQVEKIKPDIIYGQISRGAIAITHEVLKAKLGIPLVWHFKESPHEALKLGLWDALIDLYTYADGKIFLNKETQEWFEQFIPNNKCNNIYILDPELPKVDCFCCDYSRKLSDVDGAIHTVVIGRIIGIKPIDMVQLGSKNIHVHVHHENYISEPDQIMPFRNIAPVHFHVHPHVSQLEWVREFSKYDAGWLHCFDSKNQGNLMKAGWVDLNLPARINTLMAAGLPVIQKNNAKHVVAMNNYIKKFDVGVFYNDINDLTTQLTDRSRLHKLHENVIERRMEFTFDYHVAKLMEFFRKVIRSHG